MKRTLLLFLLCYHLIYAQDVEIPDYYKIEAELSSQLHEMASDLGLLMWAKTESSKYH